MGPEITLGEKIRMALLDLQTEIEFSAPVRAITCALEPSTKTQEKPVANSTFVFSTYEVKQLAIYYLFLLADGALSVSEESLLQEIISKMSLSESYIKEYRNYRKYLESKNLIHNTDDVVREIDKILGEKPSSSIPLRIFGTDLDTNKVFQAQTIWTLINLGYADKVYSENEKKLVNHLIDRWKVDPTLVDELIDTADALLALTLEKQWAISSSMPYAKIRKMEEEIDRSIAVMSANIETTISEVEIA